MEDDSTVRRFKEIKEAAACDDQTAAILALAESVAFLGSSGVNVFLHEGDPYSFNRVGKDVAEAIGGMKSGVVNTAEGGFSYIEPESRTRKKPKSKTKK